MKNFFRATASLILIISMSACGNKKSENENSDQSDSYESDADSSSESYNFSGNTMKEDYESCKNDPNVQFCPPLTGFNTKDGSGQPRLAICGPGEAEEVCVNRYLNIEKTKREYRDNDNSAWIYTPTIKRFGDTYSFGMIRGLVVELREPEKLDEYGEAILPDGTEQYPRSSAYVAELAWADCENRQINIVKSTRINDKKYNFVNPEKYIDNFDDLRSQKIIKTYSVEGGGDIVPLNIDSTSRIDKPWREMLTKVCGEMSQGQEYNHNLPTINNWLMPDGVYANIRVDVNTLISNGSKRKFWFYVSNDNNQSDNVSPYEKTPAGEEPVLRHRASRIEVDCENKTYKMIIDRTSRLSSDWHLGSEVKPIEPKTFVYSMVFSSGANPICGN